MKASFISFLCGLLIMATTSQIHAIDGCGGIEFHIYDTVEDLPLTCSVGPTGLNKDISKNGEVEQEICTSTSGVLMLSYQHACQLMNDINFKGNQEKEMVNPSIKFYAYPVDAVVNPFDCVQSEDKIIRPYRQRIFTGVDIISESTLTMPSDGTDKTSNAKGGIDPIFLGSVNIDALCNRFQLIHDGALLTPIQSVEMFNEYMVVDGWTPIGINGGMFIGLMDLSELQPGVTYKVCAVMCPLTPCDLWIDDTVIDNTLTSGQNKGDVSKDAMEETVALVEHTHTCIEITAKSADCPDFNIDPDFTDPCGCDDPLNSRNSGGEIVLFHDVIEITNSTPGQTWQVIPSNEFYLDAGGTQIAGDMGLPELVDIGGGTYRLDIWHTPNVGWSGLVQNTDTGQIFNESNSCDDAICPAIPTIGQWGLFILILLLSSVALVYLMARRKAMA